MKTAAVLQNPNLPTRLTQTHCFSLGCFWELNVVSLIAFTWSGPQRQFFRIRTAPNSVMHLQLSRFEPAPSQLCTNMAPSPKHTLPSGCTFKSNIKFHVLSIWGSNEVVSTHPPWLVATPFYWCFFITPQEAPTVHVEATLSACNSSACSWCSYINLKSVSWQCCWSQLGHP